MHVTVVRRGGLAGVPMRGEVDTASLPTGTASAATNALQKLPTGKPPAPPRHPDGFQYEIAYSVGGATRSLHLDETEVPDELQPVIEAAMENATIG
jgi:hypothetical protein